MILIDKSKLKYEKTIIQDSKYEEGDIVYWVSKENIDNAPEIDAIPIEWMYLWRIRNMDKCVGDTLPFSDMLNDWEKENENAVGR